MSKKTDTLALMTAMNQQQSQQFMAATLLAIAIIMKKSGQSEITITPNDYVMLEPGETLEPIPTVDGGMIYRFVKVEPPLAKRVVPEQIKNEVAMWDFPSSAKAPGWYEIMRKGKKGIDRLYFDGSEFRKDDNPGSPVAQSIGAFRVRPEVRKAAKPVAPASKQLNGRKVIK